MAMNKQAKIFVAGYQGLVGSAIVRALTSLGYKNLILKTRKELDLSSQDKINRLKKLGWRAKIDLDKGLKMIYQWFLENEVRQINNF